jgi:hypothetical protein
LFSRLWPTGRRLFSALGLQRCAILWQSCRSALFLSQAGKNLTLKGKNTSKKVHIPLSL